MTVAVRPGRLWTQFTPAGLGGVPANYDRAQTLTVSHVWAIPCGKGRHWGSSSNKGVKAVLGACPNVSYAPLVNADLNQVRADEIGNPGVSDPSVNLWFNPAAFAFPQDPGRNGFVHHNSFRGPGLVNLDLSLGKVFTLKDS